MQIHAMQSLHNRKGITLLFVVSMIVLFMLLATTFLVISSQYLRGAKSYSKSEIFESDPQNELDQVLYMLLRDSRDPSNPIRTHSLLADVYGYDSIVRGNVQFNTAQYVAGSDNSFIQIAVEHNLTTGLDGNAKLLSTNKNSHLGQLLTITTGGMQGVTCRIVGHVYDSTNGVHYLRLFPYLFDFYTDATSLLAALNTNPGPEFIINGRPFDGTGAGYAADSNGTGDYDAGDSLGNASLRNARLTNQALRPNRVNDNEATLLGQYVGIGDVNEDYDAPDYQNCFLAGEVPVYAGGNYTVTVLPSFHRPALMSNQGTLNGTLFRPNDTRFPRLFSLQNFGNPGVSTANVGLNARDTTDLDGDGDTTELVFEWDVDNDNDRIKDSIWLDPNLPVVTDSSGRTYKRMFAILCRDMDGKFNLNAHSNRWHLDNEYTVDLETTTPSLVADELSGTTVSSVASNDGGLTAALPRGQGFGPPEINMRTLMGTSDFQRLMYGDAVNGVWGRNGQDSGYTPPRPGMVQAMGVDRITRTNLYDVSQGLPIFGGVYGSYPDIQGRMTSGVDFNGLPVFSLTTSANEIHENEYERNVNDANVAGFSKDTAAAVNTQTDAAFSYAEIERILRGGDNDATSLPDRILSLAPNAFNALNTTQNRNRTMFNRLNFGGHSFDIPSIPLDFVEECRRAMTNAGAYSAVANPVTRQQLIMEDLEEMLPPELFTGMPLDVNRIFGDGEDQNGDLIVDNHWGFWSLDLENNPALLDNISEAHFDETDAVSRNLDLDNDGLVGNADFDEHLVRYENAKYLYVMMRMILRSSGVDTNPTLIQNVIGNQDLDGDTNFNQPNDLAIFVAQWAINVVDFRDKDSIMTPFEFDLNPFDGWHVDGNPAYHDVLRDGTNTPIDDGTGPTANVTWRGNNYTATQEQTPFVVFGLEKPTLLMTETLAFHDRRTEDTDDDGMIPPGNPDPPGNAKGLNMGETKAQGDSNNDQRLEPLGATFIELYNARSVNSVRTADVYALPAEISGYDVATNNGIDLRRVSNTFGVSDVNGTTEATKSAPVWRIVMTRDNVDLDVRNATNNQFRNRDQIERVIYFVVEDNGDMTADPFEYLKTELRYDLPARVLQRNGMFLLSRTTFDAMSPMTGISSAVIGTAAIPIVGTDSYIAPLGRKTNVTDETMDVKYVETRSLTLTPGTAVDSLIIRDLDAAGTGVANYQKNTLCIPIEDLNISKPIGDYEIEDRTRSTTTVQDMGGTQYDETVFIDTNGTQYVFDNPFDVDGRPAAAGDNLYDNFPRNANRSVQSYRILHLQRLANPLAGWHPQSNPYLTVDTMPVDLAVFDGIDQSDFSPSFTGTAGFGTKERGEAASVALERSIWGVEPGRNQGAQTAPAGHYFQRYLEDPNTPDEEESLGHSKLANLINYSFDTVNNPVYGGNTPTFASLNWNNRPFVNAYEMMLVPHTSSSQLLRRYRPNRIGANNFDYTAHSLANGYGHLLNYFQSSSVAAANQMGPDFCRLFDYVHTPSRFTNTSAFLNPTTFGTATAPDLYLDLDEATTNADSANLLDDKDPGFRAPLNLIRNYREPGKVNLNTVFTQQVWDGVNGGNVGNGGHDSASWVQFRNGRRNNQAGLILGAINGPTFFPKPYRSATAGNLVPNGHFAGGPNTRRPVENGLLQSGDAATNPFLMQGTHPSVNATRHPFLRFQPRARLDNLTTTRSNVYAVWITVGYFEFDESTGQLGEELGANTGDVERHRAFYMIDRSIPVGFEPGKNHNVDKTIMLRRYIE